MIGINEAARTFHLKAGNSSYILGALEGRYLVHGYWGPALGSSADIAAMVSLGGHCYSAVEDADSGEAAGFHRHWYPPEALRSADRASTTAAPGAVDGRLTGVPDNLTTAAGLADPWRASRLSDPLRSAPDNRISIERLPLEYPVAGSGDLRSPALVVRYSDGTRCGRLEYAGYEVLEGFDGPEGLPYVSAIQNPCDTLRIDLTDAAAGLTVSLFYFPLPELPVILRWTRVSNASDRPVVLESVASASADLARRDSDIVTLNGSWSRERHFHRRPLGSGLQQVQSRGGASGHHHAPFMALADRDATEDRGVVRSVSLAYGGNHRHAVERDRYGLMRLQAGINPDGFSWLLDAGERFDTPAAVLTFSDAGFTGLSDAHHGFVRRFLTPERWRDTDRPIVANTWEAHYFDVNTENVVALAEEAKSVGAELLVLDDGWFKDRNDDTRALGDWIPDGSKFPGGLAPAVKAVREKGMEFGLWVEPEMTNPDSDLYRRHPDWILRAGDRPAVLARNQLVLDLSRTVVVEYLLDLLSGIFSSAPITYVKWDMNRYMSEIGSTALPPERQGETAHRYMLGLYGLWERLGERFPHILFEGCAGGGGRFDFGSLAYTPQFWTSDQTDAVERQKIQFGTSLLFPPETMGAHVSAVPNHQVGRLTPAATRGLTALAFNYGYELDLAAETPGDRAVYAELSKLYKSKRALFRTGRFLRLLPAPRASALDAAEAAPANRHAWAVVAEDASEAMVFCFQTLAEADDDGFRLPLRGLTPGAVYRDEATGAEFDSALLENLGLWLPPAVGDYRSAFWNLKRIA